MKKCDMGDKKRRSACMIARRRPETRKNEDDAEHDHRIFVPLAARSRSRVLGFVRQDFVTAGLRGQGWRTTKKTASGGLVFTALAFGLGDL